MFFASWLQTNTARWPSPPGFILYQVLPLIAVLLSDQTQNSVKPLKNGGNSKKNYDIEMHPPLSVQPNIQVLEFMGLISNVGHYEVTCDAMWNMALHIYCNNPGSQLELKVDMKVLIIFESKNLQSRFPGSWTIREHRNCNTGLLAIPCGVDHQPVQDPVEIMIPFANCKLTSHWESRLMTPVNPATTKKHDHHRNIWRFKSSMNHNRHKPNLAA